MTITIRLKTDNAAFADDKDAEVTRIICFWLSNGVSSARLFDLNGNPVGTVTVTGK